MNWIPAFDSFGAWALFAAIPVGIVLLYFLKLRREPVQVPSTYLWSRTIEDLHVNSLLQRLRRNLLLLLQLLALLLALLALLRPGVREEVSGKGRTIYLLDNSASMQATDVEGDGSRSEAARREIAERIEAMGEGDSAMLLAFSDRAEVLQSFTSDRRRLQEALRMAKPSERSTTILPALRAAEGLADSPRTGDASDEAGSPAAERVQAELHLFSDGGFQPVNEFSLGHLEPVFHAIGSGQPQNLAVTAFSVERSLERPHEVDAFAAVANLGKAPGKATASLLLDGRLIDAAEVELEPGEQVALPFTIESEEAATLELSLDAEDGLAIDNHAYAGLAPLRTVSVLVVTPGNRPLELGLATENAAKVSITEFASPEYLESDAYAARAAAGTDDLIIYDRCSPPFPPSTHTFSIGALPSDRWQWAADPAPLAIVDVDQSHPLMRFLELFSILILQGRPLQGPEGTVELISSDEGTILALADRDGFQDLVLGFEILSTAEDGTNRTNTNWYAERSWPVFVLNVLRYLAGAAETSTAPNFRPGETVRMRLESAVPEVVVRREGSNESRRLAVGAAGLLEIAGIETPGNYRVEAEGRLVDLFSVNLFDRREGELSVAEAVEIGYQEIAASTGGIERRRELWRWLLVAMLGMLGLEWWYYSKRLA